MQAVMSIEEVAGMVPSTITWREPVEIGQLRGVESGAMNRANVGSPRGQESPADGGHLSDGDTPASGKVSSRTRLLSGGSPGHGGGAGLTSSSSSPNLAMKDQDQGGSFTETTQIIGRQARLQEKPLGIGSSPGSESVLMPVAEGVSPGSPQVSRQTIRSRARPRRSDEPSPFLSVDNLPVDKVVVEGKQHSKSRQSYESRKQTASSKKRPDPLLNGTGRKTKSPPQSAYTPPVPTRSPSRGQARGTPSATPYNYNSFFTHKSSAFLAGPPNLWSMGNKYWPQHGTPNDRQKLAPLPQSLAAEALAPRPNTQVSQPFKQDVDPEVPVDRPVSPSQDLKERTIYALREVTRALNRQQSPPQSRRGGRLLKGRLKPLHTFKLPGPTIDNCKGVQPEEMDHGPSESRMLQRKRELLSMLPADIFQPRPATGESIHRTSVVSQLSTDRDKDLEDETGRTQEGTEYQISSQDLFGARMPPNSLASLSDDQVFSLQDALTSHIDIPEASSDKDAACAPQEDHSVDHDDRSRVHQISEAYATSYESGSKVDLSSRQVEEASASGDAAATVREKTESEREGSVKEEVMIKATMSDYMNEGGAARVLSDMVQRVTNSAKKSTVEEDADADQKYDAYFADSETQSETPTSRAGSSTLMRRRSSMDDMEMDQASCELTDMVSEDGLGEDGSVKRDKSESNMERGSLSSLSKAKAINPEDTATNGDTECQNTEDPLTPTNKDLPEDASSDKNLDRNPSLDKIVKEPQPSDNNDIPNSTLYTYIDSGLVGNEVDSPTTAMVNGSQESTSGQDSRAQPTPELKQNDIPEDGGTNKSRTESVDKNETEQIISQNATEAEAYEEKSDVRTESGINGDEPDPSSDAQTRLNDESVLIPVLNGTAANPIPDASPDNIPVVQIEVTGPESEIASEVPDSLSEGDADTRQSTATAISEVEQTPADSEQTQEVIAVTCSTDGKHVTNKDQCNGERTDLSEDENENLPSEEDNNKDAQDDGSSSCHNGSTKYDKDQDGSQGGQGGSHGNSGGSTNGNGGGSNGNGGSGNGNVQTDPPTGTDNSGTQRHHEITVDDDACSEGEDHDMWKQVRVDSDSNAVEADNINSGSYEDYEDDIPDIDEPFLFCGVCGLDEDMCVCLHSTFNEKLSSRGNRPTTKSASTAEDRKCQRPRASNRSSSAVGGMLSSRGTAGPSESWRRDAEMDGELIQKHLVLEYQTMIERAGKGFLSEELTSPRHGEGFHMLLQGTGMRGESRQSSAKRRPQSFSSECEFRDHRIGQLDGPLKSCGGGIDQSGCSVAMDDPMGDSGCWSEVQGGLADRSSKNSSTTHGTLLNGDVNADSSTTDTVSSHQSSPASDSLEVVAKPLSKPRQGNASRFPTGPVPAPLCFKVNAKPPPGYLYYFAYGAEMNRNRLSSYIGREVDHRLWGVLFGFQLTFNKRGADLEAGGFPNIAFSPGSSVEGCVYLITQSELKTLDQHTGCPKFYTKAMFPVWMMNCDEPKELGVAQYCIPALTYVAQDKWTLSQDEKQPIESDYSIGQCLKGADLLTPPYIQHVSTLRVH